jgi:hypothetical protein
MASEAGPGAGRAEQVYVTHCAPSDSVGRQHGFVVRATSTDDRELLRFAFEYPGLSLPPSHRDFWDPLSLPRRLALVPAPGGRRGLIHSVYLGHDTLGRPGNYFTHIIFYPRLAAEPALTTWASPDWVTAYPPGAPQRLAPFEGLPRRGPVGDEALAAFLADGPLPAAGQSLATCVHPARLSGDARARHELTACTARGCRLVLAPGTADLRRQFYLVGEPGLLALLLYAAARALPPDAQSALTFSTYEDAHFSLRQYRHARVAGTFPGDSRGLDADYFTRRGFALDTFQADVCSPELRGPSPEGDRL